MKRLCLYFLVAVAAFGVGILTSLPKAYHSIVSQTPIIAAPTLASPCAANSFTLMPQPEAPLQLKIIEANCHGTGWNARLTLRNFGPHAVRGYEVANSEDYEHKKGVESSQGVETSQGVLIAPGAIEPLNFVGGFKNGLSYGKPTGSIQKNVFWIKRIEFSDGTSWQTAQER